jgi:hypothetical protein
VLEFTPACNRHFYNQARLFEAYRSLDLPGVALGKSASAFVCQVESLCPVALKIALACVGVLVRSEKPMSARYEPRQDSA